MGIGGVLMKSIKEEKSEKLVSGGLLVEDKSPLT